MLIESSKPLTVRLRSGKVHLTPGQPMEFSEEDGLRLLAKAKGTVRLVERGDTIVIESEAPAAKAVYFFRQSTGVIVGPARVDFAAKTGEGSTTQFWLCVTFEGTWAFIDSVWLRSRKEFETQVKPTGVTLVKEPR